ncbi:RpiR family transcriptional regulator, partial [Streptococcus mitis]|nr:RpiR family transcriptional regulator [Streptococcus mitis]
MKNIEKKKKISVRIKNVNVYFNKRTHILLQKELIPMIK